MSEEIDILKLLSEAFGMSKSEARRKIKQNAFKVHTTEGNISLESTVITSPDFECSRENLDNKVVQFGKRHFRRFKFDPEENDWQIWG